MDAGFASRPSVVAHLRRLVASCALLALLLPASLERALLHRLPLAALLA